MNLGEKLLQARLEAGLSQRVLCGDRITRNMLSQIEHGTAKPSMDTLRYLADRLGKTTSFFLEETAVLSPNQAVMDRAREAYDAGDHAAVLEALKQYRLDDPVYDRERQLMEARSRLALAEAAVRSGREAYARELLESVARLEQEGAARYCPEILWRRVQLLGRLPGEKPERLCRELPNPDEELLFRGRAALGDGDSLRAGHFLDAVEDQKNPEWCLWRGRVHTLRGEYKQAVAVLSAAEEAYPAETAPLLERCYREMGNYERAYFYACKQKEKGGVSRG